MNLIKRVTHRAKLHFERDHEILGRTIRLPPGHMLDWIRLHHRRYDMPLADVSEQIVRKYPAARMIDVGANVGDSAAFMMTANSMFILCVEGNPEYLPLLKANLPRITPNFEIEEAYVGGADETVLGRILSNHGTAKLIDGDGAVLMRSLASILADHPPFESARLLKIDTDGHDAKIVLGSIDLLAKMKPTVFVEYYPLGQPGAATECRQMLETLGNIGYSNFHVFDNFGNHMVRIRGRDLDQMRALTAYVRSTQRDVRPSLHYYDICAFPEEDADLSDRLLKRYDWDG